MKRDKKGLSDIVITLIIVVVALIAIVIVWAVVSNLIKGGAQSAGLAAKCLNSNVDATKVVCFDGTADKICNVTLLRSGTETSAIGGVKLVFKNEASGAISSAAVDVAGNIAPLVGKTQENVDTGILIANGVNKIEVTVYFEDASGNQQLCTQPSSFTFVG